MGVFDAQIKTYATSFGLSRRDEARVRAHYPLFRLAYEAEYAKGPRRAIARQLCALGSERAVTHRVQSPRGPFPLTIRFTPADLASFREVFFGRPYDVVLPRASTLVDIGANTGMATCFFATQYALTRVIAVEANAGLGRILRANTDPLPCEVDIDVVAVSDASGFIDFGVHSNHRHSGIAIDATSPVRVRSETLRSLLDRHDLVTVDILKVDVEGAEHRIFAHDPGVLSRVRCLLMETHLERAARDELVELVRSEGFTVRVSRGDEVDTVTAVRGDEWRPDALAGAGSTGSTGG